VPDLLQALDVALYHRRDRELRERVKIAEFIGSGVPIVAYDQPSTRVVADLGVGLLAASPAELVAAALRLVEDAELRRSLADAAVRHAPSLSWDHLAARYEAILDRYLPA
jgi:glycosyltransferase involved in cell wall biosynthesis